MGRTRNWSADTTAEVFIRLFDLKQSVARTARGTGLTYQQVGYFLRGCTDDRLPDGCNIDQETIERLRPIVEAEVAAEDEALRAEEQRRVASTKALAEARALGRSEPNGLSPEQRAALAEEVGGCIDLVRQAAAQFGMTPRRFLWCCSTDARSAG